MTNKTEYQKMKAMGICPKCRKKNTLSGSSVLCDKCSKENSEYQREGRIFLRSIGICTRCRKNYAQVGRSMCEECAEYSNMKGKEYRDNQTEEQKEYRRQYGKRLLEKWAEQGLCHRCGKAMGSADAGYVICLECRLRDRKRKQERQAKKNGGMYIPRSERPEYGLCYRCGSPIESGRMCEVCIEKTRTTLKPHSREAWKDYHKKMNKAIFERETGR